MVTKKWLEFAKMMKMRFFDTDWIKGNLSDNEYDKREQEYNKFISNLLIKMNIPERVFANINFNDAKLVFFENINNKLSLKLYIGDLQNGYYQLNICFITKSSCKLEKGEILTSEIYYDDNKFYFMFIFSNLKQYEIEFLDIENLEFADL